MATTDEGPSDFAEFVAGAVRYGSTPNGVFGARVMWGTLPILVHGLEPRPSERGAVNVLEDALGPVRFVHLQRHDVVGQAVSWARAEQTAYWQHGDEVHGEPVFDFDQIDRLVETVSRHNASWKRWFQLERIEPLDVAYESVVADPGAKISTILEWIQTHRPHAWEPALLHRRQADAVNDDWVRRYRDLQR